MTTQRLPRVTSAPSLEHTDCTTCGEEIPPDGATVWIVDPAGWGNVCCTADCADHEMYALSDLNSDTDFTDVGRQLR